MPDPEYGQGLRAKLKAEHLWASGRSEEAIDTLRTALPALPFDMEAREQLIEWLTATGQAEEASSLREESLQLVRACEFHAFPHEETCPG